MSTTYTLANSLTQFNVTQELNSIAAAQKTVSSINIDCSNVISIDSAGLAMLISMSNKPNITLSNLSYSINNLCQLYHVQLPK
jgi:ABC-type transporter Mla MlaB component